jgi:hypothetical protein
MKKLTYIIIALFLVITLVGCITEDYFTATSSCKGKWIIDSGEGKVEFYNNIINISSIDNKDPIMWYDLNDNLFNGNITFDIMSKNLNYLFIYVTDMEGFYHSIFIGNLTKAGEIWGPYDLSKKEELRSCYPYDKYIEGEWLSVRYELINKKEVNLYYNNNFCYKWDSSNGLKFVGFETAEANEIYIRDYKINENSICYGDERKIIN